MPRCWSLISAVALAGILMWLEVSAASDEQALHVAHMTRAPMTLDPFKVYGTEAQSFYRQIYDALIWRDEQGRLVTGIAERWEYRGGNRWRLYLRPNVRFQDGNRLTSRDVQFSLERLIGPASVRARRRDFSFIDRVEALHDHVVDIYTKGPAPTLPARLAQFSMIVPEKRVREKGEEAFFQAPIGAGPFRLVRLDKEMAVFQRHEGYYGGAPSLKKVYFHFIPEPRDRIRMLLEGQLDILPNVTPAFTRQLAAHPKVSVVKKPASQFTYVVFDTLARSPLQDLRVRKALAYWTDVPSLIRYVAHGNGRRIPTFVMPQDFGYHPGLRPYPFDPPRAKNLLSAAGYRSGFSLSGLASEEVELLAKAVARQWKRLGVQVNLKVVSRAEAIRLWIRTRKYQAYFFAPTNLLFDASYHLKSKLDPKHPVNRFHHAEAARLVQQMGQIPDPQRRQEVLHRLQEIVREHLPVLALYQRINIYGVSDRVRNFRAFPDTILRLHRVRVARHAGATPKVVGHGAQ